MFIVYCNMIINWVGIIKPLGCIIQKFKRKIAKRNDRLNFVHKIRKILELTKLIKKILPMKCAHVEARVSVVVIVTSHIEGQ